MKTCFKRPLTVWYVLTFGCYILYDFLLYNYKNQKYSSPLNLLEILISWNLKKVSFFRFQHPLYPVITSFFSPPLPSLGVPLGNVFIRNCVSLINRFSKNLKSNDYFLNFLSPNYFQKFIINEKQLAYNNSKNNFISFLMKFSKRFSKPDSDEARINFIIPFLGISLTLELRLNSFIFCRFFSVYCSSNSSK